MGCGEHRCRNGARKSLHSTLTSERGPSERGAWWGYWDGLRDAWQRGLRRLDETRTEFWPDTVMGEALKRKQKKRTGREGMVSRVVRPGSLC